MSAQVSCCDGVEGSQARGVAVSPVTPERIRRARKAEYDCHRKYRPLLLNETDPSRRRLLYQQAYDEVFAAIHSIVPEEDTFGWGEHLEKFFRPFLKGKRVLEIGCGHGVSALMIAQCAREVVGIDASEFNVGRARESIPSELEGRLRFEQMDAATLDFDDQDFDVIYSNDLVEHLHPDDMRCHLSRAHEILRPKGHYICVTPHRDTGPHDATKFFKPRGTPPEGLHLVEYNCTELASLLREHGFSRIWTSGISPGLLKRLRLESLFRVFMRPVSLSIWLENSGLVRSQPLRSLLSLNLIHMVARKL
jgi:SAM-dependent methyltransferase